MIGLLGFLILAVGGGGLALYLGVPPMIIGAYVVGILALGAITGFSTGSGGGSSGGGGGSSTSRTKKAMDAANGFLDSLSGNSGGGRRGSRGNRSTGSVSRSDSRDRREVGSFGNNAEEDSSNTGSGPERPGQDNSHGGETTEEDYLNDNSDNDDMVDRPSLGDVTSKASDFLSGDRETEEKELTTLGQVAEDLEQEMEDLEREEEIDKKTLNDVKELSAALRQLMEDEGELRKLLTQGGGLTMRNFQDRLPKLQQLATSIEEEGEAISQRFEQVRNDIQEQEKQGKKIQQEESKLAELESELEAEEDRHEQIMNNMEELLEQNLLGDHPYNN